MAYEAERKFLRERDAVRVSYLANRQSGDKELVRQWQTSKVALQASSLTFLNLYSAVSNYPAAKTVVTNPKADQKEYPGTWRVAFNHAVRKKTSPIEQGVYQTLRYGYLETISATPANWTEARLVTSVKHQQTGNTEGNMGTYLTAQFRNVSPLKLQALVAGLNATTFTNPVIDTESYTGVWRNFVVTGSRDQDGAGIVDIIMGEARYRLTVFSDLGGSREAEIAYLYDVPADLAQGIITAWKATNVSGSTTTASKNKSTNTVDLVFRKRVGLKVEIADLITAWNCRYKTTETQYYGLTLAEADAIALTEPPAGQDWRLNRRYNESENTWTVIVDKTVQTEQTVAAHTSRDSAAVQTTTDETIGTITPTTELLIAEESGKIKRRRVVKNENCSSNVQRDVDAGKALQTVTSVVAPSGTTTITEKTVQAVAVVVPVSVQGHIKRVVNQESEYFDRYDTTESDEVPTDQAATSYDVSKASESERVVHSENASALSKPTAVTGKLFSQDSQRTQAGNYRTVQVEEVPQDQTGSIDEDSSSSASVGTTHSEGAAIISTSSAAGTVRRVVQRPTRAGNVQSEDVVETPKDQTGSINRGSAASTAVGVTHTEGTTIADKTAAAGTIRNVREAPTRAGNLATEDIVDTPTDQTGSIDENSSAESVAGTTHTEGTTIADVSATAGTIRRVIQRPTQAGNVQSADLVTTPTDQTGSIDDSSAASTVAGTTHTEGDTIADTSAAAGTKRRVVQRPTRAGNVQSADTSETPIDQTGGTTEQRHDHSASVVTHTQAAAAESDASETAGQVIRVVNTPTDFDKWRTEKETLTGKKQDTGWIDFTDELGTSYVRAITHGADADVTSIKGDFVAGWRNSISAVEDAFGMLTIRASRSLSGVNKNTYYGELDQSYYPWTTIQIERQNCSLSLDSGGYRWREVTVNKRRYTGIVYESGTDISAWYNLKDPTLPDAEADSVEPRVAGKYGGHVIYYSLRIWRTYPAVWQPSSTDTKA